MSKLFCASQCDSLFVHVADGRRWYIPATAVDGGSGIVLGGPKYEAFEVEPGVSLTVSADRRIATLPPARRGSGAVKRARL